MNDICLAQILFLFHINKTTDLNDYFFNLEVVFIMRKS